MRLISKTMKYSRLYAVAIFLIFANGMVPAAIHAGEINQLQLANGLLATVYAPQDVMEMTARGSDGALYLELPDGTSYLLIEDIADPRIVSKGDGSFHPADISRVMAALSDVSLSGANLAMPVSVYVLPFPRAGFLSSSACGTSIFLSPGVYEINALTLAFTVTHELGHVFQCRYAPESDAERWRGYLKLRGICDDPLYSETSVHMNRPAEIFAEDFRYLFGGLESRSSGRIENTTLPTPDLVSGLRNYLVALVDPEMVVAAAPSNEYPFRLSNYPNPFNPSTTIRVDFDGPAAAGGRDVEIAIYRVDGTLVRTLHRGNVSGDGFSVNWDGRDGRGAGAASGIYFYAVRSAGRSVTGKMVLAR